MRTYKDKIFWMTQIKKKHLKKKPFNLVPLCCLELDSEQFFTCSSMINVCGTIKRGNMEDKYNSEVNPQSNLHIGKALKLPGHL